MSGSSITAVTWGALGLRLAVVTLPALVVGALLATVPLIVLGQQVLAVPWISVLPVIGMGIAAGLTMGLLARPPAERLRAAVLLAGGFGLVGYAILRLLAQLRAAGAPGTLGSWLIGALLVVALQSLVLVLVWRRRHLA